LKIHLILTAVFTFSVCATSRGKFAANAKRKPSRLVNSLNIANPAQPGKQQISCFSHLRRHEQRALTLAVIRLTFRPPSTDRRRSGGANLPGLRRFAGLTAAIFKEGDENDGAGSASV
jgi:hypothetical protein